MTHTSTRLSLRQGIPHLRTIVVKVGSRIVTAGADQQSGTRMAGLVEDVAALRRSGVRVVIVSSGAIAHGMAALGLIKRPTTIPQKQACASIGQIRLMSLYHDLFRAHAANVGQVLLTWADLREKERYLNLRNTLHQLLECDSVPILNENDSVSVNEIKLGDNDTLGAQIALLLKADLYVMLTDVNGLYDDNPNTNRLAKHIPVVRQLTADVRSFASENKNEVSVGGMITKLKAAEMVTRAGGFALVGNGMSRRLMEMLSDDTLSTLFTPAAGEMSSSRRWIAFTKAVSGSVVVDGGAQRALVKNGKSLLPAGVKAVNGPFKPGDTVNIQNESGVVVARGLSNYASDDVEKIRGRKSAEIAGVLGHKSFDEIVHRDNLVIL